MWSRCSLVVVAILSASLAFAAPLPRPHKPAPGTWHTSTAHAAAADSIHIGSLTLHRCPDVDAYCGAIVRALDPTAQVFGTITIRFEFHPHTDTSKPPLEPIMAAEGGPGYATTGTSSSYVGLYAPLMDRRDLLLVDERGTGHSGALTCASLQASSDATEVQGIADCSAQLGDTRYLYGSGLAADDAAAVLDALAIDRVNLYGDSYGTFFAQTFAGRHPERVRSVVLDGAYPVRGLSPWYPEIATTASFAFDAACARSPTCAALGGESMERIRALARSLRQHPIRGRAPDGNGVMRRVEVTPVNLAYLMFGNGTQSVVYRDLDAAARAWLDGGDALPLLRMVAENELTAFTGGGGVEEFSEASFVAVSCQDYPQIYDMNSSLGDRLAQRAQSIAQERASHPGVYEPFSIAEFDSMSLDTSVLDLCLHWEAPSVAPVYPPGEPVPADADFTQAPVLVLSGDLDSLTPARQGKEAADLFANGRQVIVPNSFHVTALGDQDDCASNLVRRFVATLDVGDTSCTHHIAEVHLVPSFEASASAFQPAAAVAGNEGTDTDLRVAAAAAWTVGDVVARWWVNWSGRDVGLRGGTWSYSGETSVTRFTLDNVRFVNDLAVSGTVSWDYDYPGTTIARVRLEGGADDAGNLVIRWNDHVAHAKATINGVIGLRRIAATIYAP